jgi:hypothetical protein
LRTAYCVLRLLSGMNATFQKVSAQAGCLARATSFMC